MQKRILLFLFSLSAICFAQTGKIAGTILDADTGDPLPGANVFIKGTALGAATDIEGMYYISI